MCKLAIVVVVVAVVVFVFVVVVVKRRPAKACRQHGSIPAPAFLHAWVFPADVTWLAAVPGPHRAGACPANV